MLIADKLEPSGIDLLKAAGVREVRSDVVDVASAAALDTWAEAVAAYKHYDVLLVNAIFDGMNLIAKEAPLVNERDGVLVLSENAGAHEELGPWALSVNPFDLEEQAQAILELRLQRLTALGRDEIGGEAALLEVEELVAHLDKHKRYPKERQQKSAEIQIRFTLDRMGHVLSTDIEKGSGDTAFDEAAPDVGQLIDPGAEHVDALGAGRESVGR